MDEYRAMAAEMMEDLPPMVPFSHPDLGVTGIACAIVEDGYVVLSFSGTVASCAVLPEATVLDPAALRAALAAGIGTDGPMGRAVMSLTSASTVNLVHVAAAELVERLRAAGADADDVSGAEARAVAVSRSGEDATPGQMEEDGAMGAVMDHVAGLAERELLARTLDPIMEAHDEVAGRLHLPTLNVLAWSPAYTAAAYGWYAAPGPDGRRRRMAGYRISAFAGLVGDDPEARAALDAGGMLGDALALALARHLGRPFPADVAHALVDSELEPQPYARRLALHALCEIAPGAVPRGERSRKALVAIAWGLRTLWSPERPGSFAGLVGAMPEEGWAMLSYELSCAGIDPIPTMDRIQDAIEARAGHVGTMAWLLATLACAPALVLAGRCEPFSDASRERSMSAALRMVSEGRGISDTLAAVAGWNEARDAVHLAAVSGGEGEDLTWPALHDPVEAPGGVRIVPLHGLRAIHAEGAIGPDADGLDGLANGASDRAAPCALGGIHLSSLRAPDGTRLATLVMAHDDDGLSIQGLGGPAAGEPAPEAWAAATWFVEAVNEGRIRVRLRELAAWSDAMGPDDAQVAGCGYDWRSEANVRKAVDAFRPYMAPAFAAMPYEALLAFMASDAPAPVAATPAGPAAAPYAPPWSLGRTIRRARRRIGAWIAG